MRHSTRFAAVAASALVSYACGAGGHVVPATIKSASTSPASSTANGPIGSDHLSTVLLRPSATVDRSVLDESVKVLDRRLRSSGVAYRVDLVGDTIRITVASESGTDSLLARVASTGALLFRPVLCDGPSVSGGQYLFPPFAQPSGVPASGHRPNYDVSTCQDADKTAAALLPTTTAAEDTPDATVLLPTAGGDGGPDTTGPRYLLGPAQLSGNVIDTATAMPPDATQGQPTWYVQVRFTAAGGTAFDKLAQNNFQKRVAVALDGTVETAPTINAQSFNGTALINGSNFSESSARSLALLLQYGPLPAQFQAESVERYVRVAGSTIQGFGAGASGTEVTVTGGGGGAMRTDAATWSHRLHDSGFAGFQVLASDTKATIDVVGADAHAVIAALKFDPSVQSAARTFAVRASS